MTQHPATPEQLQEGVVDLSAPQRAIVSQWLTFNDIPCRDEITSRAELLAQCATRIQAFAKAYGVHFSTAMIGGAPYLMVALEKALRQQGIQPLYAFSQRVSTEAVALDGSVTKTAVFKHSGFIAAQSA